MVITISCPSCQTSFPVDPDKIPAGGVRVRCSACAHVFRVEKPEPEAAIAPGEGGGIASDASSAAAEPHGFERVGSGLSGATDEFEQATDAAEATSEGGGWLERDPFEQEQEAYGDATGGDGTSQADRPAAAEGEQADGFTGPTGGDVFTDPAHAGATGPAADPSSEGSDEHVAEAPGGGFDQHVAEPSGEGVDEHAAEWRRGGSTEAAAEPSTDAFTEASAEAPTDARTDEAAAEPTAYPAAEPIAEAPTDALVETPPELSIDAAAEPVGEPVEVRTQSADAGATDGHTAAEQPTEVPVQGFTFGKRDPTDKARRLARVLVSDMIMYNAERHQVALAQGTLAEDFQEEIDKSWKEYVDQVGAGMAEGEGRAFWIQALNDILAKGRDVF